MQCFRCDQEATQECPRCGALYCDDHGEAMCSRCMDPALAVPSYRVYRGSLLALLIGSVFAIWLLVRPPAASDDSSALPPQLASALRTPTATATPTASATATPAAGATAAATATPRPAATATPTATPRLATTATATAQRQYTVREGDTLFGIASQFASPAQQQDLPAFIDSIVRLNGLADANAIAPGQVLNIP